MQLFHLLFLCVSALVPAAATLLPVSVSISTPLLSLNIQLFQTKYSKKYRSEEQKAYRNLILQRNKASINQFNKKKKSYTLGQNEFLDFSEEEFVSRFTGLVPSDDRIQKYVQDVTDLQELDDGNCSCSGDVIKKRSQLEKSIFANENYYNQIVQAYVNNNQEVDKKIKQEIKKAADGQKPKDSTKDPAKPAPFLPSLLNSLQVPNLLPNLLPGLFPSSPRNLQQVTDIDWTNSTGPVRNQGDCGSCYAFATTNVLQAANSIYLLGGLFVQLSVQQVIDCAISKYNGCDGGLLEWGYSFMQTRGITTNFRYPYTGRANTLCKIPTGEFKILSYRTLGGGCAELRRELQKKPVSTSIKAKNMQFYREGVYDNCSASDRLDHAVVVVGWKEGKGWKIKNSWGTTWGEAGYGWISGTESKNCGICVMPVVPRVKNQP